MDGKKIILGLARARDIAVPFTQRILVTAFQLITLSYTITKNAENKCADNHQDNQCWDASDCPLDHERDHGPKRHLYIDYDYFIAIFHILSLLVLTLT